MMTKSSDATPRLRRTGWSVRSRVLAGMLAIITAAFTALGSTVYLLQLSEVEARIDDSLRRSVQEFRALASNSTDPAVAPAPVTTEQLLYTAMQQTLPANHEGMLSIIGDEIRWTAPQVVSLRLEDDPEFTAWALATPGPTAVRIESVTTQLATYRAVIIPVQLSSDPTPARLVFAYDYSAERREINQGFSTYLAMGLLMLALSAIVGWLLVGRFLRPVGMLRETARQISETDLSQRIEVVGNDDLAELSRTVNAMLDRLENAMLSQRQLLDDVGHELRTPLTIVQGHLELMDGRDPVDVDQVREVAQDELNRMGLLINDLVTLAKSGRVDFLHPEPTAVGSLLDDLHDKARALGDRTWLIGARAEETALLDQRRITQAMLQLCSNAVKFSAPGSTITLGTSPSPDAAGGPVLRFWVRDEGVGIAPADQARIFERFGRGANSKRTEGSGLGLNIVSAIATAHGGSVSVFSLPGQGSTFFIDIPHQQEGPRPSAAS